MKEDFYCLLFPLEVSSVLFGVNVYYFTEKISVQRPKSKCISLCCVFNSFCTPKVYIFYALKVSTVPVGLSVMQIQYSVLNHVHDVSNITQCNAVVTK